jgi:uncharacterized protein YbjT (DUF2867 family)
MPSSLRCLVTGASGYIGGRLVPELLAAGHPVRCMARDAGKLTGRPWSGDVQVAVADATDAAAVLGALRDIDVAYYLIHSLGTGPSFEQRDRNAARIFARAARTAGVQRIVYLGGITSGPADGLSPHLRSRGEVADILLASGVPTAAPQAAVIIGSGSASMRPIPSISPGWRRDARHDGSRRLAAIPARVTDGSGRLEIWRAISAQWSATQLAAKVVIRCRAAPGDLCAGTRMAWSDGQPTSGSACRCEQVPRRIDQPVLLPSPSAEKGCRLPAGIPDSQSGSGVVR